jgi:predicted nucleic acid-binding protein
VLDTSALILLGRLDPNKLPEESVITTVTLAELSVGPLVATDEHERAIRTGHLQLAESDFDGLPFDAPSARAFGRIAAELRLAGRTSRARSLDVMIAAVAVANGLPVVTCNPGDFEGITELEVIAVQPG